MIKSSSLINKSKKAINNELRREYILAQKDKMFTKICNSLKTNDEILMKYTTKIQSSACELNNCLKCESLNQCSNDIIGHIYYPINKNDIIEFSYKPCKYYKESNNNHTTFFDTPIILQNASFSQIIKEKERTEIIKYLKDFLKKKASGENVKGLYLSGSFGSGKSYILSALLNELSNKGFKTVNVYYPSLLKRLKSAFNDYNYDDIFDEILNCDILLLDDIGAENNSAWARDEVLGTILQYRMDNDKSTFFTSNFTIDELEIILSETSKGVDKIKSRRIIERIKNLTIEEKLISKNKRN